MTTPPFWKKAQRELAKRDPVMKKLIASYPGSVLRTRANGFETLIRSIVGQQISVKAAQTIWERFSGLCGELSPERVLSLDELSLRGVGFSQRKSEYVRDLAHHFFTGKIDSARWLEFEDEVIIEELVQVRGVGRWTAEMFLIFHLMRPNVFPIDDLGLQKAISLHYKKRYPVSKNILGQFSKLWDPWRSVATWYLWRSLDPVEITY